MFSNSSCLVEMPSILEHFLNHAYVEIITIIIIITIKFFMKGMIHPCYLIFFSRNTFQSIKTISFTYGILNYFNNMCVVLCIWIYTHFNENKLNIYIKVSCDIHFQWDIQKDGCYKTKWEGVVPVRQACESYMWL